MKLDAARQRASRYVLDRLMETSTARGIVSLTVAVAGVTFAPDRLDAVALAVGVVSGALKAFLPDRLDKRNASE
jgi:hypothetical protein